MSVVAVILTVGHLSPVCLHRLVCLTRMTGVSHVLAELPPYGGLLDEVLGLQKAPDVPHESQTQPQT